MTRFPQDKPSPITNGHKMQDSFLNHCRKENILVSLELTDQTEVKGKIIAFDQESIILDRSGSQQLYFMSAICCVKPQQTVNFIFNEAYRYRNTLKNYAKYTDNYS